MRAKLAWALLSAAVAAAARGASRAAEDRAPTAISDIRQESTDRSTRLVVECTGPLAYTYYSPDPLTLVVDIPEVDASKVPARINVGTPRGRVGPRHEHGPGRRPQPRAPRGAAREPRALPDLLQGQGAEPGLRAAGQRGRAAGRRRPGRGREPAPAPAPQAAATAPSAAARPCRAPSCRLRARRHPRPSRRRSRAGRPPRPRPAPTGPRRRGSWPSARDEDGQLAVTVKADGTPQVPGLLPGQPRPPRGRLQGRDEPARQLRALDGGRRARCGRCASASSAPPRRRWRAWSSTSPAARPTGSSRAPTASRSSSARAPAPAPAPLAALRPSSPSPLRGAGGSCRGPRRAGPVARRLPMPVLPEPPAAQPAPAGRARRRSSSRARTLAARSVHGRTRSASTSRTATSRTSSACSPTSAACNVVVNPGVSGKVTLKLNEVPWDQALDLILKTNGLGCTLDDNVIRIARLSRPPEGRAGPAQARRRRRRSPATSAVVRKRLSYAKAARPRAARSRRWRSRPAGTITLDTAHQHDDHHATSPPYIEKAKDLIADLDRATPQVEIEARIVVTSRNFTRDLGIQWGFNQADGRSSATPRTWPSRTRSS